MAAVYHLEFAAVLVAQLALLSTLLVRRRVPSHRNFFVYVVVNLMQGVLLYAIYSYSGFESKLSHKIAAGSQGIVLLARGAAVGELCHSLLSKYRGIWALAWRILLGATLLLAAYSIVNSTAQWQVAVLEAEVGLEFTIATVLTLFFLFARYYRIELSFPIRSLAIGFFLFSYFTTLNGFILTRFLKDYGQLWSALGSCAYLGSVLVWIVGLWDAQPECSSVVMLPRDTYARLAPGVNLRMRLLNERLSRFFEPKTEQP